MKFPGPALPDRQVVT